MNNFSSQYYNIIINNEGFSIENEEGLNTPVLNTQFEIIRIKNSDSLKKCQIFMAKFG